MSLSVAFLLVGLPLWLLHWKPAVPAENRSALSRRLYVFASLLGGVLAALGSGIWLATQLLRLLLAVGSPRPAVEIGHALALLLVAAAIVGYHARVLWEDGTLHAVRGQHAAPSHPPDAAAAPMVVEVTGATEEELRTALSSLPAHATYRLRTD